MINRIPGGMKKEKSLYGMFPETKRMEAAKYIPESLQESMAGTVSCHSESAVLTAKIITRIVG
jgi:hypothetical protein